MLQISLSCCALVVRGLEDQVLTAALLDQLIQGPLLELLGLQNVIHLVFARLLAEVLVEHFAAHVLQLLIREVLLKQRQERLLINNRFLYFHLVVKRWPLVTMNAI